MKTHCFHTEVPIYDAELYLYVTPDVVRARSRTEHLFGVGDDYRDCDALASHLDYTFGIFMGPTISRGILAHEIFHITHRIMEWTGDKFTPAHHEPYAYLCSWITNWAYSKLKKGVWKPR